MVFRPHAALRAATAVALIVWPLWGLAQVPSDESLLKLFQVTKAEQTMSAVYKDVVPTMMDNMTKGLGKPLTAEQIDRMRSYQQRLMQVAMEATGWDKMRGPMMQAYRATYTQGEVDGLIAFYQSPVGQAFVDKQPQLMMRMQQEMVGPQQEMLKRIMQEAEKLSQEMAQERKKP